jgi:parallel beta helix pectate lyase-like protein
MAHTGPIRRFLLHSPVEQQRMTPRPHATPRHPLHRPLAAALSLALGLASAGAVDARPRTGLVHVVQNCNDSGAGSLREAYAAALDGDTVDLSQLACSTITLTSGPLVSAPDAGYVTLQGTRDHPVTLDGNHAARVIVHTGSRVALNDVNATAGVASDASGGGGIYSTGGVALLDATVSDCAVSTSGTTPARGGAIRAMREVVLRGSRVSDNRAHAAQADADGGGIHALYVITAFQSTISGNTASGDGSHYARGGGVFASGYLRFDDTTVSGNIADSGAGLYVGYSSQFVSPSLTNVTISGNRASGAAGGVLADRSIKVYNSTITGNTAVFDFGAGIYLSAGSAELHSTIVADNSTGDGLNAADVAGHAGAFVDGAHNLIIASTIPVPVDTLVAEPMLAALADNGGGVQTHALLRGSPAIDAGENPKGIYNDERGYVCPPAGQCQPAERTVGPATDIGAFEYGAPDHIFGWGFDPED